MGSPREGHTRREPCEHSIAERTSPTHYVRFARSRSSADIDRLIERFNEFQFENLKVDGISGTSLSSVETDPSQQQILNTLGSEPKKIIQGPPGTGKSQSLTALITNALPTD